MDDRNGEQMDTKMNLFSIASGSSGNCVYIGNEQTHLLIDVGISCKRIEAGLKENNICPSQINGILITHEHSDHISGLGVFSRKYGVRIFATQETIQEICKSSTVGEIEEKLFCPILPDQPFCIKTLTVHPFSISHDAANPVAYRVEFQGRAAAVATDLGEYNDYIVENLKGLNAILLEANHDVNMLQTGKYPYPLKKRILGQAGHLSNEASGQLLNEILNEDLKYIFLGHLSKDNNYEALAYETVRLEIMMGDNKHRENDFMIQVAKRDQPSSRITF